MIVGILFIALIGAIIWSIFYGRKLIRTEQSDAVFGNPSRALGGWHWVISGVSSILVIWLLFSWDAGRAYFPQAANELCQVAKLTRAGNPIRSVYPLDNRQLLGTQLLERDYAQIDNLAGLLTKANFNERDRAELAGIISDMRNTLAAQANPDLLDENIAGRFNDIARRINQLASAMASEGYPGSADEAAQAEALAQPLWGATPTEIPTLPITDRGRKFDAAAAVLEEITAEYGKIINNGSAITTMLTGLKARIDSFSIDQTGNEKEVATRAALVKQIGKIYKRIDDGKIFPAAVTNQVEAALINLDETQWAQQGSLKYINALALPGGEILAGNNACSEQGSGRWLPKPSDTLKRLVHMADPDEGYKGFPLLWYKMKPISEMIGFVTPDLIADLIPGEYARHGDNGQVQNNFKNKVYNFVTGDFNSWGVPIPTGHIWDSILRVLSGLFFGIILGVPLGLFMGLSRFAKGYFDPLIELYRPIPPLAWAPLILTIFGIQDDGKIFLLFMVAFSIMVISARTGATGTQLSKIHAAHSLGASTRQIVRQVILPNSLPEILTGIRIAIGVCWGTLVAAEMLAGTTGIGFVENVARKQSDYEIIWMTIIILGLLGLMFDMVMRWVIHRSIPWRGKG